MPRNLTGLHRRERPCTEKGFWITSSICRGLLMQPHYHELCAGGPEEENWGGHKAAVGAMLLLQGSQGRAQMWRKESRLWKKEASLWCSCWLKSGFLQVLGLSSFIFSLIVLEQCQKKKGKVKVKNFLKKSLVLGQRLDWVVWEVSSDLGGSVILWLKWHGCPCTGDERMTALGCCYEDVF